MTQTDYVKKTKPKGNTRAGKSTNSRANSHSNARGNSRGSTRKPSANKKPRTSKQNTQTAKRPPYVAIILLLITLSAFGYFLWTINGTAKPNATQLPPKAQTHNTKTSKSKTDATNANVSTNVNVNATTKADIPEPPKEQWQYIDELKTKQVEVETAEIEQKGPYVMQCATFKDARRAEAFKAQLALLGFESRIKTTQSSNGPRHRVQLGPYEKNRDAQADRHKLSRHKINGCKIWLWT